MTPGNHPELVAIYDVSRLSSSFRWAWWGHRIIYVYAGYTFLVTVSAATYYSSVLDLKNPMLTRYGLVAVYLGLLAAYSLYKTARNDFSDFPLYLVFWAMFPLTVLFLDDAYGGRSLMKSPCLPDPSSPHCTGGMLGSTLEKLLYLPAAVLFFVCWLRIGGAKFTVPGQGVFRVFRTAVDTKRNLDLASRLRPTAIIVALSIPAGATAYLFYASANWLTSTLFPISDAQRELQASDELWISQMVQSAYAWELGPAAWAIYIFVISVQALIVIVGFRLARRVALKLSGRYWEKDAAPPILLLRSFSDDTARVSGSSLFRRLSLRKLRLEEVLAKELARRGTLLAIGQPGERLPKLGAHRLYFADDRWQEAVVAYIEKSAFIVVIGGLTNWVRWELEQIIGSAHHTKLIFIVPPGSRDAKAARLDVLCDVLQAEGGQRDAIISHAERIIAISLLDGGWLHVCLGNGHKQNDFELAAYFAMLAKGVAHG